VLLQRCNDVTLLTI